MAAWEEAASRQRARAVRIRRFAGNTPGPPSPGVDQPGAGTRTSALRTTSCCQPGAAARPTLGYPVVCGWPLVPSRTHASSALLVLSCDESKKQDEPLPPRLAKTL